jgi:hypothetical protein
MPTCPFESELPNDKRKVTSALARNDPPVLV